MLAHVDELAALASTASGAIRAFLTVGWARAGGAIAACWRTFDGTAGGGSLGEVVDAGHGGSAPSSGRAVFSAPAAPAEAVDGC